MKEQPEKLYKLAYDKPNRTVWNDIFIEKIVKLLKQGYSVNQISKIVDLSKEAIHFGLGHYRDNPKWAGKIPYLKLTPRGVVQERDRIGILDIEFFSFDFKANRGFILTYVLKEYHKDIWHSAKIDIKDMKNKKIGDKNIVQKLVDDLKKFDIIIGYFSSRCDLPFVRTRAMYHDIVFPFFNTLKQIDLYYFVKFKMSLDRNSLKNATKILHIVGKDSADLNLWMETAVCGDRKSLDEIFLHNVRDVRITERLYDRIKPYMANTIKAI